MDRLELGGVEVGLQVVQVIAFGDLRARGAANLASITVEVEEAPGQSASATERF